VGIVNPRPFPNRISLFSPPHELPNLRSVPDPTPANDDDSTVVDLTGWQRPAVWVLGLILKLWSRTVRIDIDPPDRERLAYRESPVALVIWHNRLFMAAEIIRCIRGGQPFHGLVSTSKDGAWLVSFFKSVGIHSIRGSTNRGAREAVTAMLEVARAGHDIGITPDGPRGPCYDFKPGGLIFARRAKLPMLLVGIEFSRFRQLGSWDRFVLPLPFSRARIRCETIDPANLPRDRDAALAELSSVMARVCGPVI